jgi:hypothetical protein
MGCVGGAEAVLKNLIRGAVAVNLKAQNKSRPRRGCR